MDWEGAGLQQSSIAVKDWDFKGTPGAGCTDLGSRPDTARCKHMAGRRLLLPRRE